MYLICLYNSIYISDGIERNTSFNGLYAANMERSFEIGKNKVFGLGIRKITGAGGKRRGRVDAEASGSQGEVVFLDEGFNEDKLKGSFRFDIKTTFKLNQNDVPMKLV